jgi:hypothetical protein
MMEQAVSTETLIDKLQNLNNNDCDSEDEKIAEENRTMCRLLNIHLRDFFDDIYIPYNFFRDANWNISKVLYDNEDVLFFNKKYITDTDENRFYEVFYKFMGMLEEIFTPDNKLYAYFKKWTDMSNLKWRSNNNKTYLKQLLTGKKYQYISPLHTTNIFYEICIKYNNDPEKVKLETEKQLDLIVKIVRKEIKEFRQLYNDIIVSYVFEYPYNTNEQKLYVKAFLNCVILAIIDFSEKLIDLHVYAIHPIIEEIIGYYTPLDEINHYNLKENDNKHLYIV